MKKFLMLTLLCAVAVAAQTAAPQQPAQPAPGAPAAPAQQKKEIKDPTEYNAYITAIQTTDPTAKIQALEAFTQRYPQSVVIEDALEAIMVSYQQLNNPDKMMETANRILQVSPNHWRAMLLLVALKRSAGQSGMNPAQNLSEASNLAQRGLQALSTVTPPEGTTPEQFAQQKFGAESVFHHAIGLAAFQNKDYATARQHLQMAAQNAPPDKLTQFQIFFPLAAAYLEAPPVDPKGLWYIARAANVAGEVAQQIPQFAQAQQQALGYGKAKYRMYHGDVEGWDHVLAAAGQGTVPPADFTVKPAPTPAEQAATLANSKDPKTMNFDEWEVILTYGDQATADRVFGAIQNKGVGFEAKVISATPAQLMLAATYEGGEKNIPDVTLNMLEPIPAKFVPKPGATVQVQGSPTSYTKQPYMMVMEKGALIGKSAVPAGAAKPPVRKPATGTKRPVPRKK